MIMDELLKHQLLGVMECWDMCNVFYLLHMKKAYKFHKNRLLRLMCEHHETYMLDIRDNNIATKVQYIQSPMVTYPLSTDDINLSNILSTWYDWCMEALKLYDKLIPSSPHKKFLSKLRYEVEGELEVIRFMQRRYQMDDSETTIKPTVQLKTSTSPMSNLRREMIEKMKKQETA